MAQINKPNEHFNTVLYTGNGSTNAITGVNFQPDLIWSKNRGAVSNHYLVDVIRGTEYELRSNSTNHSAGDGALMDSIDSDGFTLSTSASMNTSSANYVSWNWLGGGTGVSNTQGDITSTVSANTTSGFSIVKWTGNGTQSDQEIGTGLSTELKFVIAKPLETGGTTNSWLVYVNGITDAQDNCLLLETNDALVTGASGGTPNKGTTAGNLLIKAGTASNNNLNNSGTNYIAYCFAEKKGFSKFGSYTGNGNADGTFVYTGFKPAWVMIKTTGSIASNWQIFDNRRPSYNPNDNIAANNNSVEDAGSNKFIDIVSNGFKARKATVINESGEGYVYMAFAENPLVGTNNIPATAR